MGSNGAFVYILEADAVLAILPGWPARIQVAVCLTPDGVCDLALHHEDEVARILHRIASLQGHDAAELSVAPFVAGYPTRKVLFSEEQQLLSLVADSPDLTELACDYAINYRFAQEQGLDDDVATVMPATKAQTAQTPAQAPAQAAPQAPASAALSARSRAFLTHLSLPSGYAASTEAQEPECLFLTGRLERAGDILRLTITPDAPSGDAWAVKVPRVGFRDDYARFVLPRGVLDEWAPDQTARLDMPAHLFPEAMIDRFMQAPDACQVTITVRGIFVSPAHPRDIAALAAPASNVVPAKPKRRLLKSVHMAVAALVAVMVVTGHFAAALDGISSPDRVQSFAQNRLSSGAEAQAVATSDSAAALGLLAAMAREQAGEALR